MIPKISVKKRSNVGPALFGTSSALMMTLDVALGACVSEGEKMGQEERIQKAYRGLGGKRTFYDGMITCSTCQAGRCAVWYGKWAVRKPRTTFAPPFPEYRRGFPEDCWKSPWVPAY